MYVTSASNFPLSEALTLDGLLASQFTNNERLIKAGKPLFHEGDTAEYIYQIVEGVVRSSKLLANGRRQILSFGYPGDLVGMSHDGVYHSECEAISEVKLRAIPKNAYNGSLPADPAIFGELLRYASNEIANMQEHFMMLGCKTATEKIASFLVALAERTGQQVENEICFLLPMKRADIADFLGVTIETVSRTMTKLRKAGIINLPDPHSVCVCKLPALRNLAENQE